LVKVNRQEPTIAEPKTDRGRRRLTLAAEAMDALRAHQDRQEFERRILGADYAGYGLVFCSHLGTSLVHRNVTHAFKRALAAAGLPATIRLYDLRHANATAMLKAGVHPKTAAERLGHSSTTLFLDTYSHMLEELDEDAAARIGTAITGVRRQTG
jgi:integrase